MESSPADKEDLKRDVEEILSGIDMQEDSKRMVVLPSAMDDLCKKYCIFSHVAIPKKVAMIERASSDAFLDRIMGSMVGMAVGDALGHPFEFMPAQDVPTDTYFDLNTFKFKNESNAFHLQRGQWTDDASMGLCMADSLILRRGFSGGDMRVRFWCWWNRGYNNAFRKDSTRNNSVGLGGNISKSLSDLSTLRPGQLPPAAYQARGEDAGNGSLMRFTPVALFYHKASLDELYHQSRASSYTTHPGIIAAEACTLLAHLIVRAVNRPRGPLNVKEFLDVHTQEYYEKSGLIGKSGWGYDQMKWLVTSDPVNDTEACWNWKREKQDIARTLKARGHRYNGYPVSAGYFGSYSLDGLALALWAVYHTTSFDEAVTRSVNLLGDADSHGSIAAQLAGALYGYTAIHPQFKTWLNKWDDHDFALRGLLLADLGSRLETPAPLSMSTSKSLKTCDSDLLAPDGSEQPLLSRDARSDVGMVRAVQLAAAENQNQPGPPSLGRTCTDYTSPPAGTSPGLRPPGYSDAV
jgi:ADP-ribosyl-[dinitrogen reductase] hydrolase